MNPFPQSAPLANLQFLRSYSRQNPTTQRKESWGEACDRTLAALVRLGRYTPEERNLVESMQRNLRALPSGRWLWVGGTPWIEKPENVYGAYNCSSCLVVDWDSFGLLMELAMMGCGTGAVLEDRYISKLPTIINRLEVEVRGSIGSIPKPWRLERTSVVREEVVSADGSMNRVTITVGDSRQGWARAYQTLMEIASEEGWGSPIEVTIDLSHIRPAGEALKGFGGVANPVKLKNLFSRTAEILNKAQGRKLNSVECCLLLDEAALTIVAGNIRRSAGMRQFESNDGVAATAKENLWQQDANGNWRVDPERDALRMSNHTRVFHAMPSEDQCVEAVRKQFQSGEGAIMWAGEAKKRAQGDTRYGLNPCGEIIGSDFLCNLSEVHLSMIEPENFEEQEGAFKAATLSACALLHQKFDIERFRVSRAEDPIVGVSFTGGFNFFARLFGADWLHWWQAGRPDVWHGRKGEFVENRAEFYREKEQRYFVFWRETVQDTLEEYCTRHGLKVPIRCTTVQPAGSKTLLTGVGSCGWHPPKARWYVRRMTFGKDHPVAKAAIDFGYSVVPSPSDKDEQGNLLNDPFHPNCTEWLVEVPVEEPWAHLEGIDDVAPEAFPITAQWDFYMQVQRNYTTHNTSGTFEIFEEEIPLLGKLIHKAIANDEGYISCAVLARSKGNLTFPRLPFEPVSRERYEQLCADVQARRKSDDFMALFHAHNRKGAERGPEDSACSGLVCELKSLRGAGGRLDGGTRSEPLAAHAF
jgi:ribonucleotide reductase class II